MYAFGGHARIYLVETMVRYGDSPSNEDRAVLQSRNVRANTILPCNPFLNLRDGSHYEVS